MRSKKTVTIVGTLAVMVAIVVTGSMTITGQPVPDELIQLGDVGMLGDDSQPLTSATVHQERPLNIQRVSNEIIHLAHVDGMIHTSVPVAASRTFSPLPIGFADTEPVVNDALATGSTIQTKQKVVVNLALDASEDATVTFSTDNRSEDTMILLIKCGTPANVVLNMESGTGVTIHGLVGHNEWLASVASGTAQAFSMKASTTDAGFYGIGCELVRVG